MDKNKKRTWTTIIIIVIILALALMWAAYRNNTADTNIDIPGTDGTVSNTVGQSVADDQNQAVETEAVSQAEIEQALITARSRLIELRREIAQKQFSEEMAVEITQMRRDLGPMYEGMQEEIKNSWQKIDSNLEILESQVREQSYEAIATVEKIIQDMQGLRIRMASAEQDQGAGQAS